MNLTEKSDFSKIRKDAIGSIKDIKKLTEVLLSQEDFYGERVEILDLKIAPSGALFGKFKNKTNKRVFEFKIKGQEISYRLYLGDRRKDSGEASVSSGRMPANLLVERVDAKFNKKCGPKSYRCGNTCIPILHECHVKAGKGDRKNRQSKVANLSAQRVEHLQMRAAEVKKNAPGLSRELEKKATHIKQRRAEKFPGSRKATARSPVPDIAKIQAKNTRQRNARVREMITGPSKQREEMVKKVRKSEAEIRDRDAARAILKKRASRESDTVKSLQDKYRNASSPAEKRAIFKEISEQKKREKAAKVEQSKQAVSEKGGEKRTSDELSPMAQRGKKAVEKHKAEKAKGISDRPLETLSPTAQKGKEAVEKWQKEKAKLTSQQKKLESQLEAIVSNQSEKFSDLKNVNPEESDGLTSQQKDMVKNLRFTNTGVNDFKDVLDGKKRLGRMRTQVLMEGIEQEISSWKRNPPGTKRGDLDPVDNQIFQSAVKKVEDKYLSLKKEWERQDKLPDISSKSDRPSETFSPAAQRGKEAVEKQKAEKKGGDWKELTPRSQRQQDEDFKRGIPKDKIESDAQEYKKQAIEDLKTLRVKNPYDEKMVAERAAELQEKDKRKRREQLEIDNREKARQKQKEEKLKLAEKILPKKRVELANKKVDNSAIKEKVMRTVIDSQKERSSRNTNKMTPAQKEHQKDLISNAYQKLKDGLKSESTEDYIHVLDDGSMVKTKAIVPKGQKGDFVVTPNPSPNRKFYNNKTGVYESEKAKGYGVIHKESGFRIAGGKKDEALATAFLLNKNVDLSADNIASFLDGNLDDLQKQNKISEIGESRSITGLKHGRYYGADGDSYIPEVMQEAIAQTEIKEGSLTKADKDRYAQQIVDKLTSGKTKKIARTTYPINNNYWNKTTDAPTVTQVIPGQDAVIERDLFGNEKIVNSAAPEKTEEVVKLPNSDGLKDYTRGSELFKKAEKKSVNERAKPGMGVTKTQQQFIAQQVLQEMKSGRIVPDEIAEGSSASIPNLVIDIPGTGGTYSIKRTPKAIAAFLKGFGIKPQNIEELADKLRLDSLLSDRHFLQCYFKFLEPLETSDRNNLFAKNGIVKFNSSANRSRENSLRMGAK